MPRVQPVPLPPLTQKVGRNIQHELEFYPIKLGCMTIAQEIELDTIILTAPVNVRTPTTHVGWIYGAFPSQTISALDAVLAIQVFTEMTPDLTVYAHLPSQLQAQVKASFIQRTGNALAAAVNFVHGSTPMGQDHLLGCMEVWGIESAFFDRYSVLHIA